MSKQDSNFSAIPSAMNQQAYQNGTPQQWDASGTMPQQSNTAYNQFHQTHPYAYPMNYMHPQYELFNGMIPQSDMLFKPHLAPIKTFTHQVCTWRGNQPVLAHLQVTVRYLGSELLPTTAATVNSHASGYNMHQIPPQNHRSQPQSE